MPVGLTLECWQANRAWHVSQAVAQLFVRQFLQKGLQGGPSTLFAGSEPGELL